MFEYRVNYTYWRMFELAAERYNHVAWLYDEGKANELELALAERDMGCIWRMCRAAGVKVGY